MEKRTITTAAAIDRAWGRRSQAAALVEAIGGGLGFGHPDLLQRAFGFRMLALRHWHPVVRRYDDAQYSLVAVNLGDADQAAPFWFPIAGDYAEELHRGALDLENVPVLQQVWLSIPSHYGRIWTLSSP